MRCWLGGGLKNFPVGTKRRPLRLVNVVDEVGFGQSTGRERVGNQRDRECRGEFNMTVIFREASEFVAAPQALLAVSCSKCIKTKPGCESRSLF